MKLNFNVTGQERKALTAAISEALNAPTNYLGMPSAAYEVGGYHIDKAGTVTGDDNPDLLAALAERGFEPEAPAEPEASTEPEAPIDRVCIEIPLGSFTPDNIDNLRKMILAKEELIKKALGVDTLPVEVLEDRIAFNWFSISDNDCIDAYAKFITALTETAKQKKRVTATAKEIGVNDKYRFRVFMLGLGMVGSEHKDARRILLSRLEGNSSYAKKDIMRTKS